LQIFLSVDFQWAFCYFTSQVKLGQFIKSLRKAKGVSHQALADETKLNRNTIINIEGEESVRFDTLRTILNALDPSPAEWGTAANLWIRQQIGEADYQRFAVDDRGRALVVREAESLSKDARELADKLAQADPAVRRELIKVADRAELIECLRILNRFYDSVKGASPDRKNRVLYSNGPDVRAPRASESSGSRADRSPRRRPKGKGSAPGKA
jgi:transcriptional regulator with XRE-family HTH domain